MKCRAQAESMGSDGKGKKMGSFKIANMIARTDGLRGFYIGVLMTACRDGISSGIFFWGCKCFYISQRRTNLKVECSFSTIDFVFRRLLRRQEPFQATPPISSTLNPAVAALDSLHSEILINGKINKAEVGRIFLAGGLAGSLSAVVPYPFVIPITSMGISNIILTR